MKVSFNHFPAVRIIVIVLSAHSISLEETMVLIADRPDFGIPLSLVDALQRFWGILFSPHHLKWSSRHCTTSTSAIPTIFMASIK
jgi:hypothetical protein